MSMPKKSTRAKKTTTPKTTSQSKLDQVYSQIGIIILLLVACIIFIGVLGAIAFQKNLKDLPQSTKEAIEDTTSYIIEVNPKQVKAQEPQAPVPQITELPSQENIDN